MPQDGQASVTASEDKIEQAREYKPDRVTWGEVLIAGAERLNDQLESNTRRVADDVDAETIAENLPDYGVDTDALVADLKADLAPAVADEVEARLR